MLHSIKCITVRRGVWVKVSSLRTYFLIHIMRTGLRDRNSMSHVHTKHFPAPSKMVPIILLPSMTS